MNIHWDLGINPNRSVIMVLDTLLLGTMAMQQEPINIGGAAPYMFGLFFRP